jgi:hypothetical protein
VPVFVLISTFAAGISNKGGLLCSFFVGTGELWIGGVAGGVGLSLFGFSLSAAESTVPMNRVANKRFLRCIVSPI